MDMKPAGPGLMAPVPHGDRLPQNLPPGHVLLVEFQGHRVGHDFKPVIQRAVVLAVDQLPVPVGQIQNLLGILAALPRSINFQLHPKIAGAFAIKDGVRLVIIVLNGLWPGGVGVTVAAQGLLIAHIVPSVEDAGVGNQRSTAGAVGIEPLIAALAEGRIRVTGIIVAPDSLPADGTGFRLLLQAVWTEVLVVELPPLVQIVLTAADGACKGFSCHGSSSSCLIT